MRLRRLCEVKPTGKSHVGEDIRKEYLAGGDKREILEIALVESLKKWGTSKAVFNKVKASSLKLCECFLLCSLYRCLYTSIYKNIHAVLTECFQLPFPSRFFYIKNRSRLLTIASKTYVRQPAAPRFQAEFVTKVEIVRERLSSREQETTGKWFTEEKLKSCGEYTQCLGIKTPVADCVFTNNLQYQFGACLCRISKDFFI